MNVVDESNNLKVLFVIIVSYQMKKYYVTSLHEDALKLQSLFVWMSLVEPPTMVDRSEVFGLAIEKMNMIWHLACAASTYKMHEPLTIQ